MQYIQGECEACFLAPVVGKYTLRKQLKGKILHSLIPVFRVPHQCPLLQSLVTLLCSL